MSHGKISLERGIRYCPIFFFRYVCINTHMSDCVDIVYELTNKAASETFLHKSGEVQYVNWIFITGVPAWRWLSEYVTLDKMFYHLFLNRN